MEANAIIVFVAILQELKQTTVVALEDGTGISKEEAEQHEKELDKTL